jgi:hypothetical protein
VDICYIPHTHTYQQNYFISDDSLYFDNSSFFDALSGLLDREKQKNNKKDRAREHTYVYPFTCAYHVRNSREDDRIKVYRKQKIPISHYARIWLVTNCTEEEER